MVGSLVYRYYACTYSLHNVQMVFYFKSLCVLLGLRIEVAVQVLSTSVLKDASHQDKYCSRNRYIMHIYVYDDTTRNVFGCGTVERGVQAL